MAAEIAFRLHCAAMGFEPEKNQTSGVAPGVTADEVRTTAEMARLHIRSDAELQTMTQELSAILGFVADLSEVNVDGVLPTTHAVPMSCPLRDDVQGPHLDVESTLRNAPSTEATFFTVPTIIGGGEG